MGLLKFSRGTDARNWHESVLREARYFEHLDRSRFTVKDLAYPPFARDVFHDGEILLRSVRLRAPSDPFFSERSRDRRRI